MHLIRMLIKTVCNNIYYKSVQDSVQGKMHHIFMKKKQNKAPFG